MSIERTALNKDLELANISLFEEMNSAIALSGFSNNVHFDYKCDPNRRVRLTRVDKRFMKRWEELESIPRWFRLPGILFSDWHFEETLISITPYGILPDFVIGANDRLYGLRNSYLFNSSGQAVKFEDVVYWCDTSLSFARTFQELATRVDFTPKKRSRVIDLSQKDYEEIGGTLHQIENGDFLVATGR